MDFLPKARRNRSVKVEEKKPEMDLASADVKDLVVSAGLEMRTYQDLMKQRSNKKEETEQNSEKLAESQMRKWLVNHGKKHLISFDDKERYKLKQFFGSLDSDGSGSIGTDELVDPLLSLGIAESVEEVENIVDSVDDDKSGQIEFKEFLQIIAGTQENKGDTGITDFFKDMISGRLAGGQISNKLPFDLIISTVRRKKLMDSMMSGDLKDKVDGQKVMHSYSKLLAARRKDQTYLTPEPTLKDKDKMEKAKAQKKAETITTPMSARSSKSKQF